MVSERQSTISAVPETARHALEERWAFFLFEGVALLVLGLGAAAVPVLVRLGMPNHVVIVDGQVATVHTLANAVVITLLGWLLLASGVIGFLTSAVGRHAPGFVWALLSSAIAVAAGILLFFWPGGSVLPLTWPVTAFLAIDGVATILLAHDYRGALHERWYLLLASGVIDLVLAAVIAVFIPRSAVNAVGPILATSFIFGGISLIGLALAARTAELGKAS